MFDNLKDPDPDEFLEDQEMEKPQKTNPKTKKVLRFRSPIYIDIVNKRIEKLLEDDPLQARLAEFIQQDTDVDNLHKTSYLVRAFVRDTDNREYSARVPKILVNRIGDIQL